MTEGSRRRASVDSNEHEDSPPPKRRRRRLTQEYGFMRDMKEQGSTHFLGSASGIHFIRSVSDVLARNSASITHALSPDEELVPGEDDRLLSKVDEHPRSSERIWKANDVSKADNDNETRSPVQPTFEEMVQWSESYFEIWHPVYPHLHAPSVLRLFSQIASSGLSDISSLDIMIVRSIMSISLADRRQLPSTSVNMRSIPSDLVFQTVQEALAALQIALCRPTSVSIVQAAVSVQILLVSMLRYNSASRIGGLIVRMAFQLGLHRCPARFSRFSAEEAQIRLRLFWSIYCLERHLCQSLGLPLDIRDDDIDVCYPGFEEHNQGAHVGDRDAGKGVLLLAPLTIKLYLTRVR